MVPDIHPPMNVVTTAELLQPSAFPRLLESHGIFFVKFSRTWKVLETDFRPVKYITSHPCQLSLAIPPWVGAIEYQVMLCRWGVKEVWLVCGR